MTTECGPITARTAINAPYLDGLSEGVLRLQFCTICATFQFYPRPLCLACGASASEWRQVSGRGRLYALSWLAMAPSAPFKLVLPYAIALVDLEEGPRMMAHIRETDAAAIGDPVVFASAILIEHANPVPLFRLCASEPSLAEKDGMRHA